MAPAGSRPATSTWPCTAIDEYSRHRVGQKAIGRHRLLGVASQADCVVGEVTFTIIRTNGHLVRVGVDAPKEMLVLRGELVEKPKDIKEVN